jgi:tetratricopeptide (TPR) repeat protein
MKATCDTNKKFFPIIPLILLGSFIFFLPSISVCLDAAVADKKQDAAVVEKKIDPRLAEEIRYAKLLQNAGMADYAKTILDRIKDPEVALMVKVLELQTDLSMGRFDAVKAKIAALPDQNSQEAWAMKLSLADAYYAWGKYVEAQKIYDGFFAAYSAGPPEALKSFYMEAAYKYAQMMILVNNRRAALQGYQKMLLAKPERHIERQALAEMAEIMLTMIDDKQVSADEAVTFRAEIDKIIKKLAWIRDLWMAKTIVMRAHLLMLDGKIEQAMKIIEDSRGELEEMDRILKEEEEKQGTGGADFSKLSPMAQCRYLLGVMLHKEADKLIAAGGVDKDKIIMLLAGRVNPNPQAGQARRSDGAFQHFTLVFLDYPNTSWAPDAGKRSKVIQGILEGYGLNPKVTASEEKWEEVRKAQFREARTMFNQNQFAQAIDSYLKVLNLFPEGDVAISALGELTKCYVDQKDELMVDVVTHYIAERFGKRPQYSAKAGDEILKLANLFEEVKLPTKKEEAMDYFFKYCPRHPKVPAMVMRRGDDKFRNKEYELAIGDYTFIEENFPDNPLYTDALNRKSICLNETEKYEECLKALEKYIAILEKKEKMTSELLSAKYRQAGVLKAIDIKYVPNAFKIYGDVVRMMTVTTNPAYREIQAETNNIQLLEGSLYNQGLCYSRITNASPETLKAYKMQAISVFTNLVMSCPKSVYAPSALLQSSALATLLNEPEQADLYLQQLQKNYPNTQEATNSYFMMVYTLLKLDKKAEAVKWIKKIFEGGAKYSDRQIYSMAKELLDAREYEIAVDAYERLKGTKEESLQEVVMVGLGSAYFGAGKHKEAVEAMNALLKKYPNTGYTPEAAKALCMSYSALAVNEPDASARFDMFQSAVKWLKKVRQHDKTPEGLKRSDLSYARILNSKAVAEEKFGDKEKAVDLKKQASVSYYTLMMYADAKDPKVALVMEEAIAEGAQLLLELEMWAETVEACDKYITFFPSGKNLVAIRTAKIRAKSKVAVSGETTAGETTPEEVLPEEVPATPDDAATNAVPPVVAPAGNDPAKTAVPAPAPGTTVKAPSGGK